MEPRTTEDLTNEHLVRMIAQSEAGVQTGVTVEHGKAELTKRLIEKLDNLDKTTEHYSQRVLILTFVLLFIGLGQLAVAIFNLELPLYAQIVWSLLAVGAAVYMIFDLVRDVQKNP
jgi:uncharacterized membrane protein YiaA